MRNQNDPVSRIVRMVMALPLLPGHGRFGIRVGFAAIRTMAQTSQGEDAVRDLLIYVQDYWLDTIGENNLSVFGCQNRTNNHAESNNRGCNAAIGSTRGNLHFIILLVITFPFFSNIIKDFCGKM